MDFNCFMMQQMFGVLIMSSAINDSSALRSSTGIGVDWYTPIGPLSFSLAQPLSKKQLIKQKHLDLI